MSEDNTIIEVTAVNNKLILSRSNFSVPQRRILSVIVESLSPYLKNEISKAHGKEISYQLGAFDTADIAYKASDISRPDDYDELRKALRELTGRSVFIETDEVDYGTHLILKYEFDKRSEILKIKTDTKLFNLLFSYDKEIGYTLYQTKVVLSFTSIYAMRLYEIIAKWRGKPKTYIPLEELRRLTDTQDKYLLTADFKKRVLDTAKEQLDDSEITDLKFDFKEEKKGRKVVGFHFYIFKTDKAHDGPRKKVEKISLRWDFSKELTENFNHFGLNIKGKNLETVKALKVLLGEKTLARKLEELYEVARDKTNPPGYIITSLKNALLEEVSEKDNPIEMTPEERKLYAERERKKEPSSFGELLNNMTK